MTKKTAFLSDPMCSANWAMRSRIVGLDQVRPVAKKICKGRKTVVYTVHHVQSSIDTQGRSEMSSVADGLYSSDDSDSVNMVRITDKGSCSRCVIVEL